MNGMYIRKSTNPWGKLLYWQTFWALPPGKTLLNEPYQHCYICMYMYFWPISYLTISGKKETTVRYRK